MELNMFTLSQRSRDHLDHLSIQAEIQLETLYFNHFMSFASFLNVQLIPLISFHTFSKSYVEHCKLLVWDECRVFGLIDLIHRPPWAQCPL